MADKELSFEKHNETNYTVYKFGITLALRSAGLMGYVNSTEEEPDVTTKKEEWKEWDAQAFKAFNMFNGSVEMRLQPRLVNCPDTKEAKNSQQR